MYAAVRQLRDLVSWSARRPAGDAPDSPECAHDDISLQWQEASEANAVRDAAVDIVNKSLDSVQNEILPLSLTE